MTRLGTLVATSGAAGAFGIVAVGFVSLRLAAGTGDRFEPSMVLSTFPPVDDTPVLLTAVQMSWHLLWLLGLTAAVAAVGVLPPRRACTRPHAALVQAGAGA